MTSNLSVDEALEYKEKGNACVREEKYEEAILHYSHAIKLDPKNHSLFSNRSLAFLKIQQYYHAHEDALEAIRLKPDWPKALRRTTKIQLIGVMARATEVGEGSFIQNLSNQKENSSFIEKSTFVFEKYDSWYDNCRQICMVSEVHGLTSAQELNFPNFNLDVILVGVGYFRKGEVEAATFHFTDAMLSYRCALELIPNDPIVTDAIKRTTILLNKDKKANEQVPWLGAGIGIIIGVAIVLADQIFTAKPAVTHPLLMAALTISVALIGFAFAKAFRYYIGCQRKGLLDAPLDLLKEMKKEDNNDINAENKNLVNNHQRFTKAQARLKLRKGKT